MNANGVIAALIVGSFSVAFIGIMNDNSNKIRNEDNAFAKDCNDRGGVAKFEYGVRQCIGAAPSSAAGKDGGEA